MTQEDFSVEPDEMRKRIDGFGEMLRETLLAVKFLAVDGRRQELAGTKEEARRQALLAKLDQRTDAEARQHPAPQLLQHSTPRCAGGNGPPHVTIDLTAANKGFEGKEDAQDDGKGDGVAIDPDIPLLTGRKPEMGLTTSEQKAHKYENKCYICGVQSLRTDR